MPVEETIKIDKSNLTQEYDPEIFSVFGSASDMFDDHKVIARKLKNKNPYTITVIIDSLDSRFWNNKNYVKKTQIPEQSVYNELLYKYFFVEFGHRAGNELYATWLDKYRDIWKKEKMQKDLDEYIIRNELEPRYREDILKKHKNHEKLFTPRVEINTERYYNLPPPLNHVDWRNPFDTIFVWEVDGKKVFRKGGGGSSGGRETNSKFIFGFSLINRTRPIKSYLFSYSDKNKLYFIKEFPSLTVPLYDIGWNYHLKGMDAEKALSGTSLIEWRDFLKLKEIKMTQSK